MKINTKLVFAAILIVGVTAIVWWVLPSRSKPTKATAVVPVPTTTIKVDGNATAPVAKQETAATPSKPRLFRSKTYPPQTSDEKAMWEWWRSMRKTDPKFEWKMPIEFYGKVVDQFDEPVAGAIIIFDWTTVIGSSPDPQKRTESGADGLFELTGVQGKRLSVNVLKERYIYTQNSIGSFEYAAFFEDNFHVPDPSKPVIFRLQKLTGAEPMYKYLLTGRVPLDGTPFMLNAATGKVGAGDVAVSITLGKGRGAIGPDYTLNVQGNGGTVFAPSNDEFLFNAPESGYQNAFKVTQVAADPKYSLGQKLRCYMKTGTGKYAAVEVEIDLREKTNNAGFFAIIYYNPSGSRNLEFDQRKWLNP